MVQSLGSWSTRFGVLGVEGFEVKGLGFARVSEVIEECKRIAVSNRKKNGN